MQQDLGAKHACDWSDGFPGAAGIAGCLHWEN